MIREDFTEWKDENSKKKPPKQYHHHPERKVNKKIKIIIYLPADSLHACIAFPKEQAIRSAGNPNCR